jgi:para-aminobenzoate synthetase component 1
VNKLKAHIQYGNIYEITFCLDFYSEGIKLHPLSVYSELNRLSPAPMSCYYKAGGHHLISSSPERFLKKKNDRLISQPIKGTIKRSADAAEDERLKTALRQSPKERSENVMIVDLVRNDLSRVAQRGSVQVDELFGIYSLSHVHQMISTISCRVNPEKSFMDIIKATFPMGSMTGAPKISAMKLIDEYERFRRGWFSGCAGYINPEGDFDFNVIIRSIIYNEQEKKLSFPAGSAITIGSDAEMEYEECLLKAEMMRKALLGI